MISKMISLFSAGLLLGLYFLAASRQLFSPYSACMFLSPATTFPFCLRVDDKLTSVFCYVCCRLGRRFLFLEGGTQMFLCEIAVGIMIKFSVEDPSNTALASAILALICIYVAGFAWSW